MALINCLGEIGFWSELKKGGGGFVVHKGQI